jgi:exopolyphosphatase / guanosine-5'-triphosphate,3'-diphosphate pyrophosphatase
MKLATIDVGTNTTLLLVAEERGGQIVVLEDQAEITRLGRGIGKDGGLGREGIERTLAALRTYATLARQHQVEIVAVGTEGLRRASNAQEFLGPAAAILGTPIQVIDGEREAALSFLAAARSFPAEAAGSMVVVDIGGGSTEVIVSRAGAVELRRSLPLGSVRLTERHVRHDPATGAEVEAIVKDVSEALDAIALPAGAALVGTAGTVTSLAAMAQKLASYDPALVHGYHLTVAQLQQIAAELRASTQDQRERMPGLDPRRADVILAGALILQVIVQRSGAQSALVSDRGIRWGLLYERLPVA